MRKTTRPAIGATATCDHCGRPIALVEIPAPTSDAVPTWVHVGADGTIGQTGGMIVEIFDEWHAHHVLSPAAVHWLATHGDPGDPQPIVSGIELLRRLEGAAPTFDSAADGRDEGTVGHRRSSWTPPIDE